MTQHDADRDVVASDAPDELASRYVGAYDVDEPPPPLTRSPEAPAHRHDCACCAGDRRGRVLCRRAGGEEQGAREFDSFRSDCGNSAARFGAVPGATGANAANPSASASSAPSAGAGAAPGAGGADTSGRANIVGTVTVVQGNTLYVTDATGNTVKVTTNSGTTITKTATGTMQDIAPGSRS